MNFSQMTALMLAPARACYAGVTGQIDWKKRVYQSPEAYMMNFMLHDPVSRDRFYRHQSESVHHHTMDLQFLRMDERQCLETARNACIEAYGMVFDQNKDVLGLLLETANTPIWYHGGFRPYLLDISGQNGYGYDVVGKSLMHIRSVYNKKKHPSRKDLFMSPVDTIDALFVGLIVLCLCTCWNLLIHGQDDLTRFMGKSAFEILETLQVVYDDRILRTYRGRLFHSSPLGNAEGLTMADLQAITENEIIYPGNLAGFLRKRGIERYTESVRASLYSKLWGVLAHRVLSDKYPTIPVAHYGAYIGTNTPSDLIMKMGPTLVRLFLDGKLVVSDPSDHQSIVEIIRILDSPDFIKDAIFFVPRLYVLQSLDAAMKQFVIFDYVDYDDMADCLSPSYERNLVIQDLTFPTVLHYIYFKLLCLYFPKDQHHDLYKRSMMSGDGKHPISVHNGEMADRFTRIIQERRLSLLREGLELRIKCNPIFLSLLYYTKEDIPHTLGSINPSSGGGSDTLTDGAKVVIDLDLVKDTQFPFLSDFFRVCKRNNLALPVVETVFQFWLAVWPRLIAWGHFSRLVYPALAKKQERALEVFFEVFYHNDLLLIHRLVPETTPQSIEIAHALVMYLCDLAGGGGGGADTRLYDQSTVLREFISRYITALSVVPENDLPKTFVCRPVIDTSKSSQHQDNFFPELAHLAKHFVNACATNNMIWDDRILLFMEYFIMGRQIRTQLLPLRRTVTIKMPKKDIVIKSDLTLSPWISQTSLELFKFMGNHPEVVPDPDTTLIHISHMSP